MMRWLPVRASRLHRRELVVDSTTIRAATLFPFFDRWGNAEHALLVDADSSELQTMALATASVSVPLWGAMRIEGAVGPLTEDALRRLAPLWHFDPWWILREERFAFHWAAATLQATNCAGAFHTKPINVFFHRSLCKVKSLMYACGSNGYQVKRFRPEVLPERNTDTFTTTSSGAEQRGWHLAPFWV